MLCASLEEPIVLCEVLKNVQLKLGCFCLFVRFLLKTTAMMRPWILLAMMCLAGVGGEKMYCFVCAANPYCEPRDPVDPSNAIAVSSENPGVYLSKCKGVCYDRRLTHTAYGETLVYRGCYERETDCVPGCFGNDEHVDCVRCCNKNMCNSARAVAFSLPVVLLSWAMATIIFQ